MKKNEKLFWTGCGIFCVAALLASICYAVVCNDSRLVAPVDLGGYTFIPQDLPMVLSVLLLCGYVFALVFTLCVQKKRAGAEPDRTRRLNPKLGLLGLLGFLGFLGFWSYPARGDVTPFVFFLFFGFFGFFYEGKMSGTFMDERFRENAARAQLISYKICFSIMFIALLVLSQGRLFGSLEYTLIAVMIVLSIALALGIFLPEYLLYRYDHDETLDED